MYHIGKIIYGINKTQILEWIEKDEHSEMFDEAVGCDIIHHDYCGVDHDTEWLGFELDSFDVIRTVELKNYHERVANDSSIETAYLDDLRKALNYWLEEEDIDQARYDELLACPPVPKIQIIWSTS